ncbi:monovalent cation/H+ antiporter complex subunit F [Candidatus Nanohalococcus occultus]|uniref:Multicomponent Na:H antiporter subunit F n=1 Tax=Candidatus Nanohalococcus occultus TaxID=2978047 RepID=A0ABY8CGD4_9ARCH|nr:Multicomponent Na :H antiporter subunit F [Candidatus Nanohaloarchaeota archaeon SVXNc]
MIIETALTVTAALTLLCSYRVIKGPSVADRAVALDTIGTNIVALALIYSVVTHQKYFVNVSLMLAITGFIATVASSMYLKEGDIIR